MNTHILGGILHRMCATYKVPRTVITIHTWYDDCIMLTTVTTAMLKVLLVAAV